MSHGTPDDMAVCWAFRRRIGHDVPMGPVIVFLLLAVAVSLAVLALVARPHWQRHRETMAPSRHTSRTTRARS